MSDRPTALSARGAQINYTATSGQAAVVTAQSSLAQRGGYYCSTCDVLLKDSRSYTIHINGRKHQKKLNVTMLVRRVPHDEVVAKLAMLCKKHPHPFESQCDNLDQLNVQTQLEIDQAFNTFDDIKTLDDPIATTKKSTSADGGMSDDDSRAQRKGGDEMNDDENDDNDDDEGWEDVVVAVPTKRHKPNGHDGDDEDDDGATGGAESSALAASLLQKQQQQQQQRTFEIAIDDGDWGDDDDWSDDDEVEYAPSTEAGTKGSMETIDEGMGE